MPELFSNFKKKYELMLIIQIKKIKCLIIGFPEHIRKEYLRSTGGPP
jgi:hypothetical protein